MHGPLEVLGSKPKNKKSKNPLQPIHRNKSIAIRPLQSGVIFFILNSSLFEFRENSDNLVSLRDFLNISRQYVQ